MKPAGFILDVPLTLSVTVRGKSLAEAEQIARAFADSLAPSDDYIRGYLEAIGEPGTITAAGLESSTEDSIDVLEELDERAV